MITAPESAPTATGCCPRFNPAPWQDQHVRWEHKLFLKDRVRCAAWVPINMGGHITADLELIKSVGAEPAQQLMLTEVTSPFGMDLYIDVSRAVPGAEMAELSGSFFTHVFDGPFTDMRDWENQLHELLAARHLQAERLYFAYTTCPSCAQAYGHNYVIGFAKLREVTRH